jgi:hypothetical protein
LGELSDVNQFGAIIQTLPQKMFAPTRNIKTTNSTLWIDW